VIDSLEALPAAVRALAVTGRALLHGAAAHDVAHLDDASIDALPMNAQRHGVVAWLPQTLATLPNVPARVVQQSHALVQCQAVHGLERVRQLLEIVQRLRSAGVDAVLFKGPALSAWLYGDPCGRNYSDFDLLVQRADRGRALDTLQALGFAPSMPLDALRMIYASTGAWPLYRRGTCGVDLHWRLTARRFPLPLSADEVRAGATPLTIAGQQVRVPAPTHSAAIVLTHAAKHLWYSIEQVFSIALLTRRPEVDWGAVHALARRGGTLRGVAAGLRVATDLLQIATPPEFAGAVHAPSSTILRDYALAALALPPRTFPDRWQVRDAQRAAFDRLRDRVQYDVRALLEPTTLESEWLHLKGPLTALYVPARLVRLALAAVHRRSAAS
jgi:hypothetical protein